MTRIEDESWESVLTQRAEVIAGELLSRGVQLETRRERSRRHRVAGLMSDGSSLSFLTDLTDQVLRFKDRKRAARRFRQLIDEFGIPPFVTGIDRLALVSAASLAPLFPRIVIAGVAWRMKREFAPLVMSANQRSIAAHIRERAAQGVSLNVNLLGEAILGDDEAITRTQMVCDLLRQPDVTYVSVKISAICAKLDVLAFDDGIDRICDRLREVYRVAAARSPAAFVNLDMEEYRDLYLTVGAFTRVLSEPEFHLLEAGIVLQAYIPESVECLNEIVVFARERHQRGGGMIKVRLVKGANLAMERVEAELRGWEQAPFTSKSEVDANYKRLLDVAVDPHNEGTLRVGVASHNLFELGWALALREVTPVKIEIEMLAGMANPQALALAERAGGVLLYAPLVRTSDFSSAIAYLVRRFDENTSNENFLAHAFELRLGSEQWEIQRERFRTSLKDRTVIVSDSRRFQDRSAEQLTSPSTHHAEEEAPFANEPDTDFTILRNRLWLRAAFTSFDVEPPREVHAVVNGSEVFQPLTGSGFDPSNPGAPLYRYVEADMETIERAVGAAKRAAVRWRGLGADVRAHFLGNVAMAMAQDRGRTLATMSRDAGKTIHEGDAEISEAIDFARYYAAEGQRLVTRERELQAHFDPYEVVLVTPPWNFPYAIPAGGVLSALAAGSAVILMPAPESVLTASLLAEQCWRAGVPGDVLQFVPCADAQTGQRLVTHPDIDAVILTGAWETARMFLAWRPELKIHGETSGKNALVITAAADQDDAIRDLIHSAFSHAGQKCSAASLAILEASVYDDPRFLKRLADAVRSLRVGRAIDPRTDVPPLIRPPSGPLLRALTELAPGERWLVEPEADATNANLWSPGAKIGVRQESEFYRTECFGPVLGIMRADNLDHAIALQNGTGYGLTGGIHTLDPREAATWRDAVQVGNAYINRVTTGAIVRRQPFGGWRRSSINPSTKPGGPNYLMTLGEWSTGDGVGGVAEALVEWKELFVGVDVSDLSAESNVLRLLRLNSASIRINGGVNRAALETAIAIATEIGVTVDLSVDLACPDPPSVGTIEDGQAYLQRLAKLRPDRVRLLCDVPLLRLAMLDAGYEVDISPLSSVATIELYRWCREQAISATEHRHGNTLVHRFGSDTSNISQTSAAPPLQARS
jgi:RHH-type proline utilization regulon transcriptional repressor/proline dehydrogenase/delta 1-pyrroline-5-carboxylate dehydrogenase